MIVITVRDILNSVEVLNKINETELPIKTAFKLARALKDIDREYQLFTETRRTYIQKYGEKDELGELKVDENGQVHLEPDKIQQFTNEMEDLMKQTVEINVEPFDINDFEDIKLSPGQMTVLLPFIKE